ncbi:DUF1643 domain-containing protein [Ramlibacter monticola]|uniref:DUF1643 domain-containing protein n=1 Tax=Ramlibacter monticola TaxID=1926872 RepID=A0A937CV82_9BURK|nr:DUF1643 domain-containing protein [Ramlibacter monticola]
MESSADFSPCRRYRYALRRIWAPGKPSAMFVGLNPSTADEVDDDNTVTRCIGFAGPGACRTFSPGETPIHVP